MATPAPRSRVRRESGFIAIGSSCSSWRQGPTTGARRTLKVGAATKPLSRAAKLLLFCANDWLAPSTAQASVRSGSRPLAYTNTRFDKHADTWGSSRSLDESSATDPNAGLGASGSPGATPKTLEIDGLVESTQVIELRKADADGIDDGVASLARRMHVACFDDLHPRQPDQKLANQIGKIGRHLEVTAKERLAQPVASNGDEIAVALGADERRVREQTRSGAHVARGDLERAVGRRRGQAVERRQAPGSRAFGWW